MVVRMRNKEIFHQGIKDGLEILRRENQQSLVSGAYHAPDSLIVTSLIAEGMLVNVNISLYKCGLEENLPVEQNDSNEIFHHVQKQQ